VSGRTECNRPGSRMTHHSSEIAHAPDCSSAQVWRSNVRPEFAQLLLAVDVHGSNAFRVNGPLANMPEFARAFGCRPGRLDGEAG
jgi:Peptidase family M13